MPVTRQNCNYFWRDGTSSVCLRRSSRAANRASMDETKAPLPCEYEWTLDVFLSHVACRVSGQNTQPCAQDTQPPQQRKTTPPVSRKKHTRELKLKGERVSPKHSLKHHELPPEGFATKPMNLRRFIECVLVLWLLTCERCVFCRRKTTECLMCAV